jgi:hypothetical protein
MNEAGYIGVVMVGYVVYNVLLNWVYIKEYLKDNKGVIRRGNEWDN